MNKLVMISSALCCAALVVLAAGCGSGGNNNDVVDTMVADTVAETVSDVAADSSDTGGRDTVEDTAVPPSCAELIASRDMMHLLEGEGRLIVHLNAAFDGQALWLGWSSFSDSTGFGTIRAARMACDGTFLVDPFDVDPDNAGNSYEAEIAVGGGNVFIAWHQDYQGYYTVRSGRIPGRSATIVPAPLSPREAGDVIEPDAGDVIETDWLGSDTTVPEDVVQDTTGEDAFTADTDTPDATTDAIADAQPDIPVFPNDNMRVYYRTFKVDGTPIMPAAVRFMPARDGEPPLVNNWIPKVAALPDGRFVLASAWAAPDTSGFAAVAQRFNPDGTKSGGLIHPYPGLNHDQTYTDIAVDAEGNIHMVWGDTEFIDGEQQKTRIASVTFAPDSDVPMESSPVFLDAAASTNRTGDNPSVAITPAGIAFTAWLTDESIPNIAVAAQTAGRTATGTTRFGDNWYDTYPMMVAGPSGAAVVWYRWTNTKDPVSGKYPPTEVKLARLAWGGTGDITGIGDPLTVNPSTETDWHDAVQYYEPVVVDVGGGNYFVLWTDSYCDPCTQPAGTGADASAAVEAVWHYPAYGRFVKP